MAVAIFYASNGNLTNVLNKALELNSWLIRRYGRPILHRRAIRVLNSDGQQIKEDNKLLDNRSFPLAQHDRNVKEIVSAENLKNKLIVPPYEKLQKNDARFTKILVMLKHRKHREKSGKILIEGVRLINDAIRAGLQLKHLFFSNEETLATIKLKSLEDVAIQKVFYKTLKLWSNLTTCPGVMGVFKRPTFEDMKILTNAVLPVTVICDNIRDPGNLGAIIRNAASAGCRNVLLLKGCVDPWETKVLRAGSGGHFHIPIVNNIEWPNLINYLPKDGTLFVADSSTDIQVDIVNPEYIDYNESEEIEDITEQRYVELDDSQQPVLTDVTYDDPSELEKFDEVNLPCLLYSNISYPKKEIFLYVGGETHGIDNRVLKLACEFGGRKIKIPLENEMESLNAAFAFTIVLYEIKRQLSELYVTH